MKRSKMEVWTLAQIVDPEFKRQLSMDVEHIQGKVELQLADGSIRVSKRQAFLNLFWWRILTTFNIPIRKDHFIKAGICTPDQLNSEWNRYYDEIMAITSHNAKQLKNIIWQVLQDMYYFGFSAIAEYTASLDIIDMAHITRDPVMKKIIDTKYDLVDDKGDIKVGYSTRTVEDIISRNNKKIMTLLGTPGALKNERLLPFQRCQQLNQHQVPQTIYCYGIRTDINDSIVTKPVLGNALDGLNNIEEYAVESLSAKKSTFYNHESVRTSQYFGRRMHLVTSSLVRVYDGDCGSTQTVDYYITEKHKHVVIGKYIVEDGKLVLLNHSNIDKYVNTTVHMRSPMTCRYRRGVCETCGGRIYNNLNRKINLGIMAALHVIEMVTQKILSTKHLVKTLSILYELPAEVKDKLFVMANACEIRWSPAFLKQAKGFHDGTWQLGIPYDGFANFTDVMLIRDEDINENNISRIGTLHIRQGENVITCNLKTGEIDPSLSMAMLKHIRANYDKIVKENGCIWIPLEKTANIPLMTTAIINDNMRAYVASVDSMFRRGINQFTTNKDALKYISELIYSKVDVNIAHIETVLKAFQITSEEDYRIPRVEDTNQVLFSDMKKILKFRHVGSMLAFEGLGKYLNSPVTYLLDKQNSVLDWMIGYTED